jgi:hypothetical protein
MTVHPLVTQLRFTRSEFVRGLEGVTEAEARLRMGSMNSISWFVGHLANQEQYYWAYMAQRKAPFPNLYKLVGYGQPPSTPPLDEMWTTWRAITSAADSYLDTLTPAVLQTFLARDDGKPAPESVGTMLMRNIYHYWFHTGETQGVRQMLGHTGLPEFVGNMANATYYPE